MSAFCGKQAEEMPVSEMRTRLRSGLDMTGALMKVGDDGVLKEFPIKLHLVMNGGAVKGNYEYRSVGKAIELSGRITGKNSLEISEFEADGGRKIALFEGVFYEDLLVGVWTDLLNQQQLSFYVYSVDYIAKRKKLNTYKYSGSYEMKSGNQYGKLVLFPESDDSFLFFLRVESGDPDFRSGETFGRIV